MWVAKIRIDGKNSIFGKRTLKHQVTLKGYPLSSSLDAKDLYVYSALEVFGEEKNIENFIEDLTSDKDVLDYERCNRFLILLKKRDYFYKIFYDLKLLQLKPITILPTGENIYEIGSFNKESLMKFIEIVELKFNIKLDYICKKKIKHISVLSPYPDITEKQRDSFELAVKEGYYDFPKKIDLNELARKKNVAFSTFRAHLKKAESKLIRFMFDHL